MLGQRTGRVFSVKIHQTDSDFGGATENCIIILLRYFCQYLNKSRKVIKINLNTHMGVSYNQCVGLVGDGCEKWMYDFDDTWNLLEIDNQVKKNGEQRHFLKMESSSVY